MIVLVCPGCRERSDGRLDLRTIERAGDVYGCECGRRYPIVEGLPIVLPDPSAYFRTEVVSLVERDLPTEVAALLVEHGPDDAPYARLLEHLSIYLDAHWGDRAEPAVELAAGPLLAKLAERSTERVGTAVELGCSVGRMTATLAAGAEHVVAIDLHFGALRRAKALLAGERVAYHRRIAGRHYAPAIATGTAVANVSLVCGDALDPPLVPGVFDRVVALNLLDSVAKPRRLLQVIDALCAPDGELILACPYAWQSSVVHEDERLGGLDPAADLRAILREGDGLGGHYEIVDEADLGWTLRRDARSVVAYQTHYLRARKSS
ncbi:MAG: methyltransferase domain-containing protein [Kofleriaceae bacterium]